MSTRYYLCKIEGLGIPGVGGGSQTTYCYPSVPSYANTLIYKPGLAEPPAGSSAQWDIMSGQVSCGRFTVTFRPYQSDNAAGYINLQQSRPRPKTQLSSAVNTSTDPLPISSDSSVHGIAVNDLIFVDRETMLVTAVTDGATPSLGVTRGIAQSVASSHAIGADIFVVPPAYTGRKVVVSTVTSDGTSGDETVILKGYISREVSSGLHWPSFAVVSQFGRAMLNNEPSSNDVEVYAPLDVTVASGGTNLIFPARVSPRFIASGGYWLLPDMKNVVLGSYDGSSGNWTADPFPIFGDTVLDPQLEEPAVSTGAKGYQIAWASIDQTYPPFKDENGDPDDRPISIVLNLLRTQPGATAYSTFNLGTDFAADCALGVDATDVDITGALSLRDQMSGLHASQFWLAGDQSEPLSDVIDRLLQPFGINTGVNLAGKWVFLKLRDFYPDETAVVLNDTNLINPDRWVQRVAGRAIDKVIVKADANPIGLETTPQTVNAGTDARLYYPHQNGVIVGDTETFSDSPYNSIDLVEDGAAWTLIASRVRRLADRVQIYEVEASGVLDSVDLGYFCTLHSRGLRDPRTGFRMDASSTPLKCIITSLQPDYKRRTVRLSLAYLDTGNTCLISPSATVSSWDGSPNFTATCNASDFTSSDDVGAFSVGDVCVLLDSDLTLRSDDGRNYQTAVDAINSGARTISFDGVFRDSGGSTVNPEDGDLIVYAHYDEATTDQKDYGYLAEDGSRPADPNVGTADAEPYEFGDT
tara:strand:+ start:1006 stop:3267 length:2262 start_codon:yes stop_codon:yes gene_type:complete